LKNVIYYILISLLALACNTDRVVKEIKWTLNSPDRSSDTPEFYKLEAYDTLGHLIYDSTLYPSDYGYSVKHFQGKNLIHDYSEIEPNLITERHYRYSGNLLTETETYSNEDTLISKYVIDSTNKFDKAVSLLVFDKHKELFNYEKRTYQEDTLLQSVKVFIMTDSSDFLYEQTNITYDKALREASKVTINYNYSEKDSLNFEYDETGLFRTVSFTKRLGSPDYLLVKETHYYRESGYLYKITEYDFIEEKENIYIATFNYW
jgi:hypothetical protein